MGLKKSWYSPLLLASMLLPLTACAPYDHPYYRGQPYDYGYYYSEPYYAYGYANPYYPYYDRKDWERHQEALRRHEREEREKQARREERRESAAERRHERDEAKIEQRREPRPALRENAQPQRRDRDAWEGRGSHQERTKGDD